MLRVSIWTKSWNTSRMNQLRLTSALSKTSVAIRKMVSRNLLYLIVKRHPLTFSVFEGGFPSAWSTSTSDSSGSSPTSSRTDDPRQRQESGILEPAIGWQSWFSTLDDFTFPPKLGPLSPHSHNNKAAGEQGRFDRSMPLSIPVTHTDGSGLNTLSTTNDTSLLPADTDISPTANGSQDCSEQHGPEKRDRQQRDSAYKTVETTGPAWRRAKNRVAASKCRAKHKSQEKALQEAFDHASSQNAYLKRQTRLLRESVTSLKDFALQHDSSRCRCKSLHTFNKKRAERISQSMDSSDSSSI